MKIVIDGIFFQIADTGIARVWRTLLEKWCDSGFIENIVLIDRGHTAPSLPGVQYYHLPPFNYQEEALFSGKLQDICNQFNADLFISTYYTTPLYTPSVLIIHDMIPEVIGLDLSEFWWREKRYAIVYASQYITVSRNTAKDLLKLCPEVKASQVNIIHNGVDSIFSPASAAEIAAVKYKFAINSPYLLLVGSRLSLNQYKNATILFQAFQASKDLQKLTLVCVGGEIALEPELAALASDINVCLVRPTDWELRCLYSGAIALVYPSLYEGFGLPILEAMACDCPVITCHNSSLPEVGEDAVIYVGGQDVVEMVAALEKVQTPTIRNELIARGKEQAKKFSWWTTATKISQLCLKTIEDNKNRPQKQNFTALWQDFRQCQVEELKHRVLLGELEWKNTEANHVIDHLQAHNHNMAGRNAQLEVENKTLIEQIERQNQQITQLKTNNQVLQVELEASSQQIQELSNTKKTIKRLCKKALKKLFAFTRTKIH
ncbi:glycosyltransferase [Synechocystis sp. PCC 7339]|uniref:glycosyltransferase family 4 protein n=1 Tax=unclassified Synechocystis TaxID=2640012 RepID=UPI001BB07C34|nr:MULTISPECIES: glycosyltransferase [unclassified Synechocystis]QUS60997.1 glycosyltransferase [Synechocystis sp. PCC 7338]UAJ73181.1 glycosyltransferase [Synechocystis sp. PCC 7339]